MEDRPRACLRRPRTVRYRGRQAIDGTTRRVHAVHASILGRGTRRDIGQHVTQVLAIPDTNQALSPSHYERLEGGDILLFPNMIVGFSEDDTQFLLHQRQTGFAHHKNVAYRPATRTLTGAARGTDQEHLRRVLADYSAQATQALSSLLPQYAARMRIDYTSFRPFEEKGRNLSLHSRNDLLHVDAFPTRPTGGDRILRFFTNLNPTQSRVWVTSEPFPALAKAFVEEAGMLDAARRVPSPFRRAFECLERVFRPGRSKTSRYDMLMHRFHNFLKENRKFQESWPKTRFEFAPKSSWLVFTDTVSHAVLEGQFALEQTFIVSQQALARPGIAPVRILEELTGVTLT